MTIKESIDFSLTPVEYIVRGKKPPIVEKDTLQYILSKNKVNEK
jgi:hypothetical protein